MPPRICQGLSQAVGGNLTPVTKAGVASGVAVESELALGVGSCVAVGAAVMPGATDAGATLTDEVPHAATMMAVNSRAQRVVCLPPRHYPP